MFPMLPEFSKMMSFHQLSKIFVLGLDVILAIIGRTGAIGITYFWGVQAFEGCLTKSEATKLLM
jgi:hypothetical protein